MKAIILAAGRGSRMGDGTAQKPKCMMELFGAPLLTHCIKTLETAGILKSEIAIVTGYHHEQLEAFGLTCFHNARWEESNMVWSLTMAHEWLQKEPCLVVYSDIYFHPNAVRALIQDMHNLAITSYSGYWALWEVRFADPLSDLETFCTKNGFLTEIGARPKTCDEVQGQYMGLLRFTPASWAAVERLMVGPLPKPAEKLDMTTLLSLLLAAGEPIYTIPTTEQWLECDNQEDIRLYESTANEFNNDC